MAAPSSPPDRIRIISLNCWGLKYISKYRNERLTQIGLELAAASPRPDIVGLQECWTQEDYLSIRRLTRDILPHGKFYHSGIFGGGLAILSRWPITESSMVRYPLNGRPAAFYRGDWFVGKGVAHARIRTSPGRGGVVEVFCTHLHAPYEAEPRDSYLCHRTAQAWEIAKLMRHARERGHLVLGLGDFNMLPLSLAHRLIETHGGVRDVWRVVHPDSALGAAKSLAQQARGLPAPSAEQCIVKDGATCDSAYNTWRWSKAERKLLARGQDRSVDGTEADLNAKRLDYVFFGAEEDSPAGTWKVEDVNVGMVARHPTLKCSLSDHFSVETTLVNQARPSSRDSKERGRVQPSTAEYLPLGTYDEISAMVQTYTAREMKQRKWRLTHFAVELLLAIGCLVASWFSPRNFVNFLLMLLSTLGLSAGVIDGLMGGLFVGSELRALREFEWEISNARSLAASAAMSTGAEAADEDVPAKANGAASM